MGGGDLNTKKSWHPNTMKNQERVWKAEQQEAAEKRRLNELRREIDEERNREELKSIGQKSGILPTDDSDKKLEWMYRGPSQLVNREEYLLGRTIDKTFEELDAQEKASNSTFGVAQPKNHVEHECIPFSIRQHKDVLSNDQVDLARKLMEDPLMLIKQKEMESRQKILQNPVKLKELHRLLKGDQSLKDSEEKKVKKDKKAKKSKKSQKKRRKGKKHSGSSGSGSDSERSADLDKLLAEKYKKVTGEHQDGVSIDKLLSMKYAKLSQELDVMGSSGTKKKKQRRGRSESSNSSDADRRESRKRSVNHHERREDRGKRDNREETSRDKGRNGRNDRPREVRQSRRDSSEETDRRRNNLKRDRSSDRYRNKSPPGRSNNRSPERKVYTAKDKNSRGRRSWSVSAEKKPQKDVKRRSRSRSTSTHRKRTKDTKRRSRSRSPRRRSCTPVKPKPSTKPRRTPSSSSSSSDSDAAEQHTQSRPFTGDSDDERRIKKIRNFGLVTASGEKLDTSSSRPEVRLYKREEIKAEQSKQKPSWTKPKETKRTFSEKELEEKRLAMMSNAQWREKERESNVKRYESEDHREESASAGREYDKEFVTKQFKRAAASETVESRIRSNRNNIQRSNGAMDRNFVKR
ncbi:pre-mRNA-splicing factor CWC25 homolog [Anopheles moucheti]|uniref:pre-mRNA-splicing factor CWC25 homolog n=1 Tax=Anopheles moucheti TaxID=186751 RepID=UPI0022F0A8D4|nr:pre-mRNA-splicing factor CWC25 homolog [Anopheles moucheti]